MLSGENNGVPAKGLTFSQPCDYCPAAHNHQLSDACILLYAGFQVQSLFLFGTLLTLFSCTLSFGTIPTASQNSKIWIDQ